MFRNTLVGGRAKWKGPKSFELPEGGGDQIQKSGQIDSIMKIEMLNLSLKTAGYSLRLHFKIFPGPSAGLALHLTLQISLHAYPHAGTLGVCLVSQDVQNHIEGGCKTYPLRCLTRGWAV